MKLLILLSFTTFTLSLPAVSKSFFLFRVEHITGSLTQNFFPKLTNIYLIANDESNIVASFKVGNNIIPFKKGLELFAMRTVLNNKMDFSIKIDEHFDPKKGGKIYYTNPNHTYRRDVIFVRYLDGHWYSFYEKYEDFNLTYILLVNWAITTGVRDVLQTKPNSPGSISPVFKDILTVPEDWYIFWEPIEKQRKNFVQYRSKIRKEFGFPESDQD